MYLKAFLQNKKFIQLNKCFIMNHNKINAPLYLTIT